MGVNRMLLFSYMRKRVYAECILNFLTGIAPIFFIGRPTWIRTKDTGFGDRGFAAETTDL